VKKFPHLVQMHRKFGSQGLVCMSLNAVDLDAKDQAKVLEFLKEKEANFPNFLLKDDKPIPELAEKFPTEPTPLIMLFNRAGKRVKMLEVDKDLADENVEAEVKKLLDEK
jgi:thioredoxin-related protein